MKAKNPSSNLDRLLAPLGDCLTREAARRVLALRADSKLQSRIAWLANRCNEGMLTEKERTEYGHYVTYGTFVAILKSKARQVLAHAAGK